MAGPKDITRNMTQEDRDLWAWVTRDIDPIAKKGVSSKVIAKVAGPIKRTHIIEDPQKTGKKHDIQAKMDRRTTRKLAKGDLKVEAKLDLHGKSQAEAHKSLIKFILAERKKGVRVLLLVTGKGAAGAGVLRRNVPLWLESPDLAPHVLHFAEARPQHGGSGALYVLLKKLT